MEHNPDGGEPSKDVSYDEMCGDLFQKTYTTGVYGVGRNPNGSIRSQDCEKYLFIDYVISICQTPVDQGVKKFKAPWGAIIQIKKDPDSDNDILYYNNDIIMKDEEKIVISNSVKHKVDSKVKFVIQPSSQGHGGGTDFTGEGTITQISGNEISLNIDYEDEIFQKTILTRGGNKNVGNSIRELLKEKGYTAPFNEIKIDIKSWDTPFARVSKRTGLLAEEEYAYTTILPPSD